MMELFELRAPETIFDAPQRFEFASPSLFMPSVHCTGVEGACGLEWGKSNARLRCPIPSNFTLLQPTDLQKTLPLLEFRELARQVRLALDLPPDTPILPGMDLGYASLWTLRPDARSFEWPNVETPIVTQEVITLLRRHGFTGWQTAPVLLERSPQVGFAPQVFELVVTGRGGWTADPPSTPISCPYCGHSIYASDGVERVAFAPEHWDGSDFFLLEELTADTIFVTERVASALAGSGLSHYELRPFAESMQDYIDAMKRAARRQEESAAKLQRESDYLHRKYAEWLQQNPQGPPAQPRKEERASENIRE